MGSQGQKKGTKRWPHGDREKERKGKLAGTKKKAKRRPCSDRTGFIARAKEFPVFEGEKSPYIGEDRG